MTLKTDEANSVQTEPHFLDHASGWCTRLAGGGEAPTPDTHHSQTTILSRGHTALSSRTETCNEPSILVIAVSLALMCNTLSSTYVCGSLLG